MPVHEYVCRECKKVFNIIGTFELFINLVPICPDCGSKDIVKKIFAPAIIFRGKDFYSTQGKEERE